MTDSSQRVIGVDPGIHHTGYGIIEQVGGKIRYLESGTITTNPRSFFPARLQKIYNELGRIVEIWRPTEMAIEETIYAQNVQTALKLGQARGVVVLAGANSGLSIAEYSPKKVKLSVVGNGAASKEQVKYMITRLLGLAVTPASLDESDGLAIAICHFNQNPMIRG